MKQLNKLCILLTTICLLVGCSNGAPTDEVNYDTSVTSQPPSYWQYEDADITQDDLTTLISKILSDPNMSLVIDTQSDTIPVSWDAISVATAQPINTNCVVYGKSIETLYYDHKTNRFYGTQVGNDYYNKVDITPLRKYSQIHATYIVDTETDELIGVCVTCK